MGLDAARMKTALDDAFTEQFKLLFQQLCASPITETHARNFENGLRIACDGYAHAAKLIAEMTPQA